MLPQLLISIPRLRPGKLAPLFWYVPLLPYCSMVNRKLHVIAYDVVADERRTQALKACKGHGLGGQKSVHECLLSNRELRELSQRLENLVDARGDRLMVLRLDPRAEMHTLGKAEPPPSPAWFYIG